MTIETLLPPSFKLHKYHIFIFNQIYIGKQLLNQEEDLIQVQHAVGKVTDFPVDIKAFLKYMKVLVLQPFANI